ncbi:MAG: DUF4199 domain-containing protein [Flavobacteriales bacterium]|nr:DUF4199 domain-containing protein [Flavobacteriales bacterium]
MLKNPFQVAVTFSIVALVVKLILFYFNLQFNIEYIKYSYMLILLIAIFFGIRSGKIAAQGPTTFGQDFRSGARTASFFALIVGVITYTYYAKIDTEFFPTLKAETIAEYTKSIPELVKEKGLSEAKELVHGKIMNMGIIFTPYSQTMYTLFGLVFLGLFHSAALSFIMRKIAGFK